MQIVQSIQNRIYEIRGKRVMLDFDLAALYEVETRIFNNKAIEMNIAIMRAFVKIRRILLTQSDVKEQLKQLKEHLSDHDAQLNQIYDAMENLSDEKAAHKKWKDRDRVGFKLST